MIVRKLEEVIGTECDVDGGLWQSRRLLLKDDGMGFSLHETIIKPEVEIPMYYQHHLEAVYCIEGEGQLILLPDKCVYPINPGTLYALDQHDRHILRARTEMKMICVFNPPLIGDEVHDANGTYPLLQTGS